MCTYSLHRDTIPYLLQHFAFAFIIREYAHHNIFNIRNIDKTDR
jgi:hypothetical protein